jgi:hypothetical protein
MCRRFIPWRSVRQSYLSACVTLLCLVMSSCLMPWERGIGDECDEMIPHRDTSCDRGICVLGICEPFVKSGEACVGTVQCLSEPQICRTKEAGSQAQTYCLPRREQGDSCVNIGLECDYTQGLLCFQGVCSPPQPQGAPCKFGGNGVPACQEGLTCSTGRTQDFPLTIDEFRQVNPDEVSCMVGGQPGEGCDAQFDIDCAPGLECVRSVCVNVGEMQ